jgi:two-component system nitrate/nitrite response regulator NarL
MDAAVQRIFIVDDHQMIIDGLKLLIAGIAGFEIVGESNEPAKVVALLQAIKADILLTDVNMPKINGIELCRQVKNAFPEMKILAISMNNDRHIVAQMIDAGAHGFILKNTDKHELSEALNKIAAGERYLGAGVKLPRGRQ